jgi:hypothetical protein
VQPLITLGRWLHVDFVSLRARDRNQPKMSADTVHMHSSSHLVAGVSTLTLSRMPYTRHLTYSNLIDVFPDPDIVRHLEEVGLRDSIKQ